MGEMTRRVFCALTVLAGLALAAAGEAAAECTAECSAKKAIVLEIQKRSNNHTHCVCGCPYGLAPDPALGTCQPDRAQRFLPGSAEWTRTLAVCEAQGRRVLANLRAARQRTGALETYALQACSTYDAEVRRQNLGGCQSTCGRQACDSLMQLRQKHRGKDFAVRAEYTITMRYPCDSSN